MGATKPNHELTTMQLDILQFHKAYTERFGVPPPLRTMARHFQVYPNTIRYHLRVLTAGGYLLEKEPRPVTARFVISAKGRRTAG